MSKAMSKKSTLTALIDSDGEEDQLVAGLPTPDTSIEKMAPAKKGRGKAKAAAASPHAPSKVTKSKAPARRLSGRVNAKTKAPAEKKGKRQVLADKTNVQASEDADEEADNSDVEMEDVEEEEVVGKTAKKNAPKKVAAPKAAKNAKQTKQDRSVEPPVILPAKEGRPAKKHAPVEVTPEKIVPETQFEEEEMEIVEEEDPEEEDIEEGEEEIEETIVEVAPKAKGSKASKTSQSDPDLRRKLGEMTKKYDSITAKYEALRDLGEVQAKRNFDDLKKSSDESIKASAALIASLKADVAHQKSLAKDSIALKKKLETQKSEMDTLQIQVANLKASLAESQAENKALAAEMKTIRTESAATVAQNKALTAENKTISAKLAANRTAAAAVESIHSKVPGSAVKVNGGIRMVGTAEAAQLAQAAQLKEDIYSDLTGLIIQGVKREAEEDIFNCLQTGINGTLHFKLATANDKSSEGYADAECSYVPQLDSSRDKSLMEVLPDYLTEEILFPRPQAAKFYARVVKALANKVDNRGA